MSAPIASGLLQWGHGDEAVEEVGAVLRFSKPSSMLQWGHGDEAVEEAASSLGFSSGQRASMGPRR